MPLSINCWPSISGSESFVNIEYESFAEFDLQNVVVAIPCHQPPRINQASHPPGSYGNHFVIHYVAVPIYSGLVIPGAGIEMITNNLVRRA